HRALGPGHEVDLRDVDRVARGAYSPRSRRHTIATRDRNSDVCPTHPRPGLRHVPEPVPLRLHRPQDVPGRVVEELVHRLERVVEIGRASCRERGELSVVAELVALSGGELDAGLTTEVGDGGWSGGATS